MGSRRWTQKWNGGRPGKIDEATAEDLCRLALTRPQSLGKPFTTWSVTKLHEHLVATRVIPADVSPDTMRRVLRRRRISFQHTKTWKESPDPDFDAKNDRILDLYDHPPAQGRVICFDEFGPLNLQPAAAGAGTADAGPRGCAPPIPPAPGGATCWRRWTSPAKILYRIHRRKRWQEFLAFLKLLRAAGPHQRLYIILDNFSPHRRQEVRDCCAHHNVELVFLPTYASWLNWIESEFAALRYFTLNGADYARHAEQNAAIRGYIRWRNARARPKRHFAINSKIRRTPESDHYLPKVS
ncbi:MAG: IS630 family transposase [Actinomycetota bacterium]|nr:IS630 family transposase [Actinomycetota bacterium]